MEKAISGPVLRPKTPSDGGLRALQDSFFHYRPTLLKIALRSLRNPDHAEDMVQQTFLRAWCASGSFRGDAQMSTWLTRILFNEMWQFQRRSDEKRLQYCDEWSTVEAATFEDHKADAASPEESQIQAEKRHLLREAIAGLPAAYRSVVALDVYTELTAEQKGVQLNLSTSAVKSRSMRGRAELLRRLRERLRLPKPSTHPS